MVFPKRIKTATKEVEMTDNELFFKLCALAREFGGGERENKLTPIKYLIAACNYAANIVKGHVKDDSEAVKKLLSIMPLEDTTLIMAHTRLADFYDAENGVDASDEVRYFYSLSESCGSYVSAYDMYCLCLIACRDFAPVLFAFMEHSLRKQGTPLNDPDRGEFTEYSDFVLGKLPFTAQDIAPDGVGKEGAARPAKLDEILSQLSATDQASRASAEEADDEEENKDGGSGGALDLDELLRRSSLLGTDDEGGESSEKTDDPFDFSTDAFKKGEKETGTGAPQKKAKKNNKIGASGLADLVSKVKKAQNELLKDIFGQDAAVNTFIGGYFNAEFNRITATKTKQPRGVFLFAGPPGVGKTFLAEKSAEVLNLPFRRFDMSEYSDKESNFEFAGSDKVYKNGSEGNVTGFVAKNPNAIILFDEIEKAHLNIIHLFLQILDAGRLRDNFTDEEVSFADTIIIFTTNAGKQLYEDDTAGKLSSIAKKTIVKALGADINPVTGAPMFPQAIISRLAANNVVMLDKMSAFNLEKIARNQVQSAVNNFTKNTGIDITVDDSVYSAIMFAEGGAADARTVKGKAKTFLAHELYEAFRLADDSAVDVKKIREINFTVEVPESGATRELFVNDEHPSALVFADDDIASAFAAKGTEVYATTDPTYAFEVLKTRPVSLILIDLTVGLLSFDEKVMNIEDMRGKGFDFLSGALAKFPETPCYLIQNPKKRIGNDEMLTFTGMGVRGEFETPATSRDFKKRVTFECEKLHRQKSMLSLAKSNRVLSFDTRQTVSSDGEKITVTLYDFRLAVSLDTEDNSHVLTGERKPTVKFDDVVGAAEAKGELKYFVEYLKNPERFMGRGVKAPRGVLLYGPPGTGKTMLAKAMAGESDVTFISAEGNEFLKRYVGEGPQTVHELFRSARKYAPCILFIDEIDAIGVSRNAAGSEGAAATLTSFLTEMDGFRTDPKKPVFVLAATNYSLDENSSRSLDGALLRRFDRRILIDLPNLEEREKYLRLSLLRHPIIKISEEEIRSIARRSVSMSLADLESVVELAMRDCIKASLDDVDDHAFDEAFENYRSGDKKKWDEQTVLRTARHESGHAVISLLAGNCPSYLTIVSRGNFGGYMQKDDVEKFGYTRKELLDEIRICLGGRAAELVCYGEEDGVTTGPSSDLRQATNIAKRLVGTYGMDESFGLAVMDEADFKDKEIREKINDILKAELKKAVEIISENRILLDRMVTELLAKNHLSADEIKLLAK